MEPPVKSARSAEVLQLDQMEKDLVTRLRDVERRINQEENDYIFFSAKSPNAPSFGNLLSGWEGLLEGKAPDKQKATEKIYARA
jgi:hypothetical protein